MKNESRKERRKKQTQKKKREKQKDEKKEKRQETGKREGKRMESPTCLLSVHLWDILYPSFVVTMRQNAQILSRKRRLRIFRIILPVLAKMH